jgi:hypothetical protein
MDTDMKPGYNTLSLTFLLILGCGLLANSCVLLEILQNPGSRPKAAAPAAQGLNPRLPIDSIAPGSRFGALRVHLKTWPDTLTADSLNKVVCFYQQGNAAVMGKGFIVRVQSPQAVDIEMITPLEDLLAPDDIVIFDKFYSPSDQSGVN